MAEILERIDPLKQLGLVPLCRLEHLKRYSLAYDKINPVCNVLDIACGFGYGSGILAKKASRVVGVDLSEEAINYAVKTYGLPNIEFIVSDIEEFSCPGEFDAVTCFETIEHVRRPEKALKKLHENLKPSGILYLSVPNGVYDNKANNFHIHQFEREELKSLLEKCGFNVEMEYCQHPFAGIVLKMLSRGDNPRGDGNTKSVLHNLPLIPELSARLYPKHFADTALGIYYIARAL